MDPKPSPAKPKPAQTDKPKKATAIITPAEPAKPKKATAIITPAEPAKPKKAKITPAEPAKPKPAKTTSKEDPPTAKRVSFSEEDDECIDWDNLSAEDSDDAETEESADNGSDGECEISGDEDVFDLAAFKQQNGAFNQEEAEKAFRKWKSNRDSNKKPPAWFTAHNPPPIQEEAFLARRRDVTLRLINSYKEKLNAVNQDLQIPDLKPALRKKLLFEKSQYETNIAAREQELK